MILNSEPIWGTVTRKPRASGDDPVQARLMGAFAQ